MRQVRRKVADPSVRKYLLKAKEEGIQLSWNRYEKMLPQDGFGSLGLTCFDCLQGPCRINPFSRVEERTICGLSKEDLVFKGLVRFVLTSEIALRQDAIAFSGSNDRDDLLRLANDLVQKMKALNTSVKQVAKKTKHVGLGVLKPKYINICLEDVSPALMQMVETSAKDLTAEAADYGAEGFNIVLAGDVSPLFPFGSVGSTGEIEFAVLTGLLDGYFVGQGGLGTGKNVTPYYHTVYAQTSDLTDQKMIKALLIQAAAAYNQRNKNKILASDDLNEVDIIKADFQQIKTDLEKGELKGICILGGGSSVKTTQGATLCEAVARMSAQSVLCLTYGNAAVTLAKSGCFQKYPLLQCIGSELDGAELVDLTEKVGSDKIVALFPELNTARDLLIALALAGRGVQVLTTLNLPVEGSQEAAEKLSKLIKAASATDCVTQALTTLGL